MTKRKRMRKKRKRRKTEVGMVSSPDIRLALSS